MKISRICRKIAGPCMLVCFLICCGIVGTIESGGSLASCWIGFASIIALGLVLLGASKGGNDDGKKD